MTFWILIIHLPLFWLSSLLADWMGWFGILWPLEPWLGVVLEWVSWVAVDRFLVGSLYGYFGMALIGFGVLTMLFWILEEVLAESGWSMIFSILVVYGLQVCSLRDCVWVSYFTVSSLYCLGGNNFHRLGDFIIWLKMVFICKLKSFYLCFCRLGISN
jgi:hypothetical protein